MITFKMLLSVHFYSSTKLYCASSIKSSESLASVMTKHFVLNESPALNRTIRCMDNPLKIPSMQSAE